MSAFPPIQRRNSSSIGGSARDRRDPRPPHRERDFGIGYGTSSGYAPSDGRHYTQLRPRQYFRCG